MMADNYSPLDLNTKAALVDGRLTTVSQHSCLRLAPRGSDTLPHPTTLWPRGKPVWPEVNLGRSQGRLQWIPSTSMEGGATQYGGKRLLTFLVKTINPRYSDQNSSIDYSQSIPCHLVLGPCHRKERVREQQRGTDFAKSLFLSGNCGRLVNRNTWPLLWYASRTSRNYLPGYLV